MQHTRGERGAEFQTCWRPGAAQRASTMGDAGKKVRFGNCPGRHLASQGSIADDVQWRCSTSLGRVLLAFIGDAAKGAGFRSQEFREPAPPLGPQTGYLKTAGTTGTAAMYTGPWPPSALLQKSPHRTRDRPGACSGVVMCSLSLIKIPHDPSKDEPRICKRPEKVAPEVPARIVNRRSSRWITTRTKPSTRVTTSGTETMAARTYGQYRDHRQGHS
jgi:hypothetical protein